MVKPDGVQRRVVGEIVSRFEKKGYLLKAMKLVTPKQATLEEHYKLELLENYYMRYVCLIDAVGLLNCAGLAET